MSVRIVIKYNRLPEIAKKLPAVANDIVRKAAFDIEANAKLIVPFDTGKLKNSISCEFPTQTSAIVAPHTEYAGYVEFGTHRQGAKPYMRPAAEKVKPSFMAACKKLEDYLQ
jgi:HK97 gp10 family phage protein